MSSKSIKKSQVPVKQIVIFVLGIILAILLVLSFILGWWQVKKKPEILTLHFSPSLSKQVVGLSSVLANTLNITPDILQIESLPESSAQIKIDILFSTLGEKTITNLNIFKAEPIDSIAANLPLSTRNLLDNFIPLALDHIEIAYRRDLIEPKGILLEERIQSLSSLETALASLSSADFVPLLVAGNDPRSLLDFISVLTLSLGQTSVYNKMESLFSQIVGLTSSTEYERFVQDMRVLLSPITLTIKRWSTRKILHSDWLQFSKDDVSSFARSRRCAAIIMRLSEHRTWPVSNLANFLTSPFPFLNPSHAGTALVCPVYGLYFSADSLFKHLFPTSIEKLLSTQAQTQLSDSWGLSPVHRNVPVVDREAGDLRYWAAASRELLIPLGTGLQASDLQKLAEIIQSILR